jgi:hypothetical protein
MAMSHAVEDEPPPVELSDYSAEVREELGRLLSDTPAGEWGQLGLCPGPFGCPFETEAQAIAAGVREHFCPSCRIIHAYKPL